MARKEGRVLTRRNHDADWRALTVLAQWLYDTLLSQPGLSYCGVIDYTPKRWAELAADITPRKIAHAITELIAKRFLLLDDKTEELLIRTLMKNDGVIGNPNLEKAARRDFLNVHSVEIRTAILEGLPQALREGFAEGSTEGSTDPLPEGSRGRDAGPPSPSPHPHSSSSEDDEERASPPPPTPLDLVWHLMAKARLGARIADRGPVSDPGAWLRKTAAGIATEHQATAVKLVDEHPDWPPHRIAAELEPGRFANDPVIRRENALEGARKFGATRVGNSTEDEVIAELAARFGDDAELVAVGLEGWRVGAAALAALASTDR